MKTPVLLLTGYLGSGKTTLLNRVLNNQRGIRFAVIVNDIGEVNIDADLIQKGGIVGQDDSGDLVALQNGCICCSLQPDLIRQISDLLASGKFDYLIIEASGICEPAPIAQTICTMEEALDPSRGIDSPRPHLDCIATVVDALRLKYEFNDGENLSSSMLDSDELERLIIEQIEFCNLILLNKISEVSAEDASRIKAVIKALQPKARIIECDYCNIDLSDILNTNLFDFEDVATSATWVQEIEKHTELEDKETYHHHKHEHHHEYEHEHHHKHEHEHDDHECHCEGECHCGHHHDHDHDHVEEFGIGTFLYYRRRPFNFEKFDRFVNLKWPKNIIRTKGVLYFGQNRDMSLLFEQAGVQKNLREAGYWYATASEEELMQLMQQEPGLLRDWDDEYGDRMIKLVFIGKDLDKEELSLLLDDCLEPR